MRSYDRQGNRVGNAAIWTKIKKAQSPGFEQLMSQPDLCRITHMKAPATVCGCLFLGVLIGEADQIDILITTEPSG